MLNDDITLENQIIDNIGHNEELRFWIDNNHLVAKRIHKFPNGSLEITRTFSRDSYDQLKFCNGDEMAKALYFMAIDLRSTIPPTEATK